MPNTPNYDLEKPERGATNWDVPLNSNFDKIDAHTHAGGSHNQVHAINGADHTGTLDDAQIPSTIARDTEVTTAVSNHEAAANPHPTYETSAEAQAKVDAHTGNGTDAHDASAISILDTANDFTATDVEGALAELQSDNEAHVAAADPHTGYRLESADHTHQSTGAQAGTLDHGLALTGLTDDDHTIYLKEKASGGVAAEVPTHDHSAAGEAGTVSHASLTSVSANQHHNQAHVLDGADHTISGKTAGQFLRATSATAFAFEAIAFSRGATLLNSGGVATVNLIVWRAPFACTVTNVRGYRVGGTGATVNARRNGTDNHLSSAVSLSSADTWTDGGAVQNTAYAAGDKMEIMVVSVTGTVTQVAVQIDLTRP